MSYTNKQKTDVKDIILSYSEKYIERFSQQDIVNKAEEAMDNNETSIKVADAVYDYVYENHCGDIVISTAINQCMPKDVLLIMRQEIIKALT